MISSSSKKILETILSMSESHFFPSHRSKPKIASKKIWEHLEAKTKKEALMSIWYSFEAIAKELNIPVKTIYFYHEKGDGPRVHKFGKHLRVSDDDFNRWKSTKQITN